jgi:hypothetical protein
MNTAQASALKLAMASLGALVVQHMALLDEAGSLGAYRMSLLRLSGALHYDASACKALSVLPEASQQVYRPAVGEGTAAAEEKDGADRKQVTPEEGSGWWIQGQAC